MAKEAYYFSHDSNARHDPKITAMRSVYGSEGYGWFWVLIEMMREADEYKLDMQGKYTFNAYAKQMDCECNAAEQFVNDCINEFNLFSSDGAYFWSESLQRRMDLREQTSEKRRNAANVRWKKNDNDANAMQMHSNSNANGMQGKESKRKESKRNESKLNKTYLHLEDMEHVKVTQEEMDKLIKLMGNQETVMSKLLSFASWILTQPPRKQASANAYLTVSNWYRRDKEKRGDPDGRTSTGDAGNIVPLVSGQQKKFSQFVRRA